MIRYGTSENLTKDEQEKIEKFLSEIKDSSMIISVYTCFPIIETIKKEKHTFKMLIIAESGIFAFYFNSEDEKKIIKRQTRKMIDDSQTLSDKYDNDEDNFLRIIDIAKISECKETILKGKKILDSSDMKEMNAIIQKSFGLTKIDERKVVNENSLGGRIKKRNNTIYNYDEKQFNTIIENDKAHLRIRGLAGSGKTIVMVQKMAWMHFREPDLELAYVFYTKSLKQYIETLFREFYKSYDNFNEPRLGDKVKILHNWGGSSMHGFYSLACQKAGQPIKRYNEVPNFSYACKELNNTLAKKLQMYDHVFIDEAQDFYLEFFELVKKTLKPNGKITYAYDELQDLIGREMPNKKLIFKSEPCDDLDLKVCYRTPKEILVTAHALGLGVYNKDANGEIAIVNMIKDFDVWEAVGYRVFGGELDYGKKIQLERAGDPEIQIENPIIIKSFSDPKDQYSELCNELKNLIENHEVIADDILIIDLDGRSLEENFNLLRQNLSQLISNKGKVQALSVHLVNKDNSTKFRFENSIPYTTIYRAKGNEASIVFILNAGKFLDNAATAERNKIFTAMTRSKFRVYLYGGSGIQKIQYEYAEIKKNNFVLDFVYPTKKQLEKIRNIAEKDLQEIENYEKAIESSKKISDELRLKLLLEQAESLSTDARDQLKNLLRTNNEQKK